MRTEIDNKLFGYHICPRFGKVYAEIYYTGIQDNSEKIQVYINIIKDHQKRFNLEVLISVLEICSLSSVQQDGMMTMLFMAAAGDIIETETNS
jgi:hypothetical protein